MSKIAYTGTLLLTRRDLSGLLSFDEYLAAVENAFRLYEAGKALEPGLLHVDSRDGEFHIKAGGLELTSRVVAIKVNGGFFNNLSRFGMPNIQGMILLCDGENGYPIALMDSAEITLKRTGAAAAIAAKHLARKNSSLMTICGAGAQGRVQLASMASVLPITKCYVFDLDLLRAKTFADEMSRQLNINVDFISEFGDHTMASDVWVTCTPSKKAYLAANDVSPGAFIAAMGADSPEKQELDPELLRGNKVVVDLLEQCRRIGELHHAMETGMSEQEVHAELGEIITGKKPGRTNDEEIVVFDGTGTALQDVAAAAAAYKRALAVGKGEIFDFFS